MKLFLVTAILLSTFCMNGQTIDSVSIKQVDSLIQVSRGLAAKGDFDKALELYTTSEYIAIEKFGKGSALYAKNCFYKGVVYHFKTDYPQAEKWYLETLVIRKQVLGKENLDYANSLNNLGVLYFDMGNYEKAEPFYLEAKGIREKVLGKEHNEYAASLNNLAIIYWSMGNYEKAEPIYLESKAIREKVLGKEHPKYAEILNNLGALYMYMGNYEKAESFYLEAKGIREKVLGKEHPNYAGSLNNLGVLYKNIGNYEKAKSFYLEAKAIQEKVVGKEHPDYALSLNNLAGLYSTMGNYEKAEPFYLEAKEIRKKVVGIEHPDYANSLNNLGVLYFAMGNYEKAEPFYLEAKAIREKVLGKEHPDYAYSLTALGGLYRNIGNYEKAEQFYLDAKAIQEKVLGKEHPNYASSLNNLGVLYALTKRYYESEQLEKEFLMLNQNRLTKSVSFLSEKELANYAQTFQGNGNQLSSFISNRLIEKKALGILPSLNFDHILFLKGFLLSSAIRLNFLTTSLPEAQIQKNLLKSYNVQLSKELSKPLNQQKYVAELEEKANIAEKKIAQLVNGNDVSKEQVKWQQVQNTLKASEAAIEFFHFKLVFPKKTDSIIYAALLLKPGLAQPLFIQLFEQKALDTLLVSKSERRSDYVNDLYTMANRGASAIGAKRRSLVELIFKPLEKELDGITTIYYSPSGLLHRINLDAIPVSETETLADRYNLVVLNSTRQLVIPSVVKNTTNDAVLFGGIRYEVDTTLLSNQPIFASKAESQLSFNQNNSQSRGGSWDYLPGTEREVNAIEKITTSGGIKTTLKKGYDGTEEAFKNIGANNASSPRILHIATHGYFFPDPKEKNSKTIFGDDEPVFKLSDHPMLRSGLIMAGGNITWKGEKTLEGREDGVLTAYEISQMNLSNTELVVLSACETGLGTIQGNEGVYGLQRAFKIAGAKYLIMSLWQVPDKQTSLLMTTFYKKWLENKMNIPDAFHAAQKELRDIGLDPYQWAGFVLVE